MQLLIKSMNSDGEIEFYRTDEKELMVSILNGHGETYYTMNEYEIKALVDYIKLTDERLG
jgi:hypothetical protein